MWSRHKQRYVICHHNYDDKINDGRMLVLRISACASMFRRIARVRDALLVLSLSVIASRSISTPSCMLLRPTIRTCSIIWAGFINQETGTVDGASPSGSVAIASVMPICSWRACWSARFPVWKMAAPLQVGSYWFSNREIWILTLKR